MELEELKSMLEKVQNLVKTLEEKFQVPAYQSLLYHFLSVGTSTPRVLKAAAPESEPAKISEPIPSQDAVEEEKNEEIVKKPSESNKITKLSKDVEIAIEILEKIFDFEAGLSVPPIITKIDEKSLSAQQRTGILLLLYVNSMLNENNQLKSSELSDLLEKSKINPKNLFNAFPPGGSEDVQKEGPGGKNYRITRVGRMKAREILKQISDKLV